MKLGEYLTIKDAAAVLGVHPETLRRWDWAGKVVPARHPVNGYRLYRKADLERLITDIETRRPKQGGRSGPRATARTKHRSGE